MPEPEHQYPEEAAEMVSIVARREVPLLTTAQVEPHSGLTLVIGGARSGKSRRALELLRSAPGPWHMIVTAMATDDEMAARIARHRAERDAAITVHEVPLAVAAELASLPGGASVVVDCLTLWLSNHLLADHDLGISRQRLLAAARARPGATVLVANEVGLSIVPDNALARRFRDEAGLLNQAVAAIADRVEFMVAGLPMPLKPPAGRP